MHSHNIGELDQSPTATPTSTVGAVLGVLFVLVLFLTFALVAAVGLRKKLKSKLLNLKPQKSRQYLEECDYVTHTVEPHQNLDGCDKNEGESLELRESDGPQTDKDKDYYFMDTTLIGAFIMCMTIMWYH